jgi:ubiquinone/menaquinone biosynthesis C-methylase UbiE
MRANPFNRNVKARDEFIEKTASRLVKPGMKVLDVGAGDSPYRKYFKDTIYKSQDAIPLESHQLRDGKGYGQIDIVSDICNIPVEDESMDVVLCTEVLEHVPDPIAAVNEITRILKKDGILILTAPLGSGIHQAPYHFYGGYTKFWYARVLENYQSLEVEANGNTYDHMSQELLRLSKYALRGWRIWNLPLVSFSALLYVYLVFSNRFGLLDKDEDFTVGYHVIAKK